MLPNTVKMSSGTVPAFLSKLWALVENPECDDLICWDLSGKSFHVFDQGRFAKEILPQYFKHSNIASFIRQLNMYGFRKVVNIEQGLKTEKEDLEFQHFYFQRGQEGLLENIKRKVTQQHILPTQVKLQPSVYSEYQTEDIQKVLTDVKTLKGRQDAMNSKLQAMKRENEVLWREVASLRQKHGKQQQIVNKLIQFLVHLAGANHLPTKRKRPLMISDSSENLAKKAPKYSKSLPLTDNESYRVQSPHEQSDILSSSSGPIIHDITDILKYDTASSKTEPTFKEEVKVLLGLPDDLLSPPLDPTSSQDIKPEDLNLSLFNAADLFPVKVDENSSTAIDPNSLNLMTKTQQSGEVVPCSSGNSSSDLMSRVPFKGFDRQKSVSEMSDHVETLQTDLDGLKDVLSNVSYNFDTSTLLNLFNAEVPLNLSGTDSILSGLEGIKADPDCGGNGDDVLGNEVVQYKTDEPLPDLFDLAELSKEDDVLSTSSVDCFRKQSLETPNPVQISADDLD